MISRQNMPRENSSPTIRVATITAGQSRRANQSPANTGGPIAKTISSVRRRYCIWLGRLRTQGRRTSAGVDVVFRNASEIIVKVFEIVGQGEQEPREWNLSGIKERAVPT